MSRAQAPWQVLPLDSKAHDRTAFSCGAPELDRYIREHASQDVKRDVARVFVALQAGKPTVCGYYSLSATSFQRDSLPADQAKRLPRYPVPAALLGRLAVDDGMKGKGLGAFLLMDALNRILLATQTLAVHALIVDAKDDAATSFYRKYGFIAFTGSERRLFLPMATIRQLLSI
ncbi:GNAT family N-acetyltransferase [Oceanibaculum pacificum]|uniref:GNAT family acetyltransferase n=1 Tax=Oceanibaculum pacificum TaxID=580166 RepID=A0A154WFY5_9PROT|nr:GNAT family N-acetyltransferase [Oceanibaculum pacificum]KZD12438.1 GNAT family acetyltransferase [Oceanibaculum pacificum]